MSDLADKILVELTAMWRFALRLTANEADAEDLVQRTCVKALENEGSYTQCGRLRSWLFRIEHRIWLNELRSRQIRNNSSFENNPNANFWSDTTQGNSYSDYNQKVAVITETPESNLHYQQIVKQVESLPDAQRLVVLLVCVEEFSYQETANILDIPIGTVMSRLSRGRLTLGKAFRENEKAQTVVEIDGEIR